VSFDRFSIVPIQICERITKTRLESFILFGILKPSSHSAWVFDSAQSKEQSNWAYGTRAQLEVGTDIALLRIAMSSTRQLS
jgi:hypothetical protein